LIAEGKSSDEIIDILEDERAKLEKE